MTNREMKYEFFISYENSYHELVQEVEDQLLERRSYFNMEIEDVTENDSIYFNNCELSIITLRQEGKVELSNILSDTDINQSIDLNRMTHVIQFRSLFTFDTPKTRRQLQKLAKNIPGQDALLLLNSCLFAGVRMSNTWKFVPSDLVLFPNEDREYLSKSNADLDLDERYRKFQWEKSSMFDPYTFFPFDNSIGWPMKRFDWQLFTNISLHEMLIRVEEVMKDLDIDFGSYLDFDNEYIYIKSVNEKYTIEFIIQKPNNFVDCDVQLANKDTYLLSYGIDITESEDKVEVQIKSVIDNIAKRLNFECVLWNELKKPVFHSNKINNGLR